MKFLLEGMGVGVEEFNRFEYPNMSTGGQGGGRGEQGEGLDSAPEGV
jgi:hypothetical protein